MNISERLQMIIKMNRMSNASFADKIGVQRSSISHVLSGRNKPSVDFIQKILDAFPKVDANWLVSGRRIGKTEGEFHIIEENPIDVPAQEKLPKETPTSTTKENPPKKIRKIVLFYDDNTFEAFSQ